MSWLLTGDVSQAFQAKKYLYDKDDPQMQRQIAKTGFVKQFLDVQNPDVPWGIS